MLAVRTSSRDMRPSRREAEATRLHCQFQHQPRGLLSPQLAAAFPAAFNHELELRQLSCASMEGASAQVRSDGMLCLLASLSAKSHRSPLQCAAAHSLSYAGITRAARDHTRLPNQRGREETHQAAVEPQSWWPCVSLPRCSLHACLCSCCCLLSSTRCRLL